MSVTAETDHHTSLPLLSPPPPLDMPASGAQTPRRVLLAGDSMGGVRLPPEVVETDDWSLCSAPDRELFRDLSTFKFPGAPREVLTAFRSTCKGAVESVAVAAAAGGSGSVVLGEASLINGDFFAARLREGSSPLEAVGLLISRCRVAAGRAFLTPESIRSYCLPEGTPEEAADAKVIRRIASDGAHPVVAPTFVANGASGDWPSPRRLYLSVRSAILELVATLVTAGRAVVLPRAVARKLPGVHVLPVHWVAKQSNPLGRLIADASAGDTNINAVRFKETARVRYGSLDLPQFLTVARMILEAVDSLTDPVASIDDVAAAFSNIPLSAAFSVSSVLEVELLEGEEVSVLLSSMYFGATTSPFIWDVFARSFGRRIRLFCEFYLAYVDDCLRLHERCDTKRDAAATFAAITELLSPGSGDAYAHAKALHGVRQFEFIGWLWDLDTLSVALPLRGLVRWVTLMLRSVHLLRIRVAQLQALGSLMSRYGILAPHLAPLNMVVFQATVLPSGDVRRSETVVDNPLVVRAVVTLWLRTVHKELKQSGCWSAQLDTFRMGRPTMSFQFDAALDGAGVVSPSPVFLEEGVTSFNSTPHIIVQVMWAVVETKRTFGFTGYLTSADQNATELFAVLFGVAAMVVAGVRNTDFTIVGDSQSALAWATGALRCYKGFPAFALLGALLKMAGLRLVEGRRVLSGVNVFPDRLSRGDGCFDAPELASHTRDTLPAEWVREVLSFIDPLQPPDGSVAALEAVLARADSLCEALEHF